LQDLQEANPGFIRKTTVGGGRYELSSEAVMYLAERNLELAMELNEQAVRDGSAEAPRSDGVGNPMDLKPGDRMPDGTICAGILPRTGKPMYTTPNDAP